MKTEWEGQKNGAIAPRDFTGLILVACIYVMVLPTLAILIHLGGNPVDIFAYVFHMQNVSVEFKSVGVIADFLGLMWITCHWVRRFNLDARDAERPSSGLVERAIRKPRPAVRKRTPSINPTVENPLNSEVGGAEEVGGTRKGHIRISL